MKQILFFILGVIACLLQACDGTNIMPRPSGSPYEVLVVMDEKEWKGPAGKALFEMLSANTPGITQAENMFSISRVNNDNFTDMIRIARNVIRAEVSEKYTKAKITYKRDVWASPQVVIDIVAPDDESFIRALNEYNEALTEFIVDAERKRQEAYYRQNYSVSATNQVNEQFGGELFVPHDLSKTKQAEDFFWASNASLEIRKDIIVYSFPYTDPNTFTEEYLLQKRDSVLKQNIPGPKPGTYMATEFRFEPIFNEIWKNGRYCAEIRGWWRVEGEVMGGPFISHSQLDEINNRVVTIEAFIYAPGHNKRTSLRQLEAVVYSMKLPQDLINNVNEE